MTAKRNSEPAGTRRRAPNATALGFVAAFVLSTATIIYTGLKVGAPRERAAAPVNAVEEAAPRATATADLAPATTSPAQDERAPAARPDEANGDPPGSGERDRDQ